MLRLDVYPSTHKKADRHYSSEDSTIRLGVSVLLENQTCCDDTRLSSRWRIRKSVDTWVGTLQAEGPCSC